VTVEVEAVEKKKHDVSGERYDVVEAEKKKSKGGRGCHRGNKGKRDFVGEAAAGGGA
jgi:hypothetical protein